LAGTQGQTPVSALLKGSRGDYADGQAQGPAPTLEKLQEIVDELNNQTKNASDTEHSMKSSSRNEKSHGVHLELECAKSIFC